MMGRPRISLESPARKIINVRSESRGSELTKKKSLKRRKCESRGGQGGIKPPKRMRSLEAKTSHSAFHERGQGGSEMGEISLQCGEGGEIENELNISGVKTQEFLNNER